MHGRDEDMLTYAQALAAVDALTVERDQLKGERDTALDALAAHLAKHAAPDAAAACALDALATLVRSFPELATSHATHLQQRALRYAMATLAENGK